MAGKYGKLESEKDKHKLKNGGVCVCDRLGTNWGILLSRRLGFNYFYFYFSLLSQC